MLLHVPAVLGDKQVQRLRQRLAEANWHDGRETVGEQGASVKQNRQMPENSALAQELGQIVLTALQQNPLFFSAALPASIVPPLFNCYAGGEHYGDHVDGAIRPHPGTGRMLRTDASCTLFLSEPEEYDGGELVIMDTYGAHEVKLAAGDLILYPASSVHRVQAVTRGERFAAFFWLQSMVRDTAQRQMLFELDQHIQGLRSKIGDCTELVGLTSHYHNLLRRWAEV